MSLSTAQGPIILPRPWGIVSIEAAVVFYGILWTFVHNTCIYVCMHTRMCIYVCIYIYIDRCIYTHIYFYTYIPADVHIRCKHL